MDSKIITKYVYSFSPNNEPVETVKRRDPKFKTLDCFSNQIKSEEQLITTIDFDHVNSSQWSGLCRRCRTGDVLVVDILRYHNIRPGSYDNPSGNRAFV